MTKSPSQDALTREAIEILEQLGWSHEEERHIGQSIGSISGYNTPLIRQASLALKAKHQKTHIKQIRRAVNSALRKLRRKQ